MAKLRKHSAPPGWKNPLAPQQPLTSMRWIVGATLTTLAFALLCVYVSICLLFWQGQWQLVFHPSRTVAITPAMAGLPFEEIAFDTTETGVALLRGWWIPASAPTARTVLFLHGNSGSLANTVPALKALHGLGVNVFAFDYRGFGQSENSHPSERKVNQDADAAWNYLTQTRHIAAAAIALDGMGLGASIAAETAARHGDVPAVILEDPVPPMLTSLQHAPRMRLLPMTLLFDDRFDPAKTLSTLRAPKLFLYASSAGGELYYEQAAQTKQKAAGADALAAVAEFLKRSLRE